VTPITGPGDVREKEKISPNEELFWWFIVQYVKYHTRCFSLAAQGETGSSDEIQVFKKEVKMLRNSYSTLILLLGAILLAACGPNPTVPTSVPNLPNPASVYCEQNGGTLDLRQDATGGVAGICIFPGGSECDEWAYYRGECRPVTPAPIEAQDPSTFELSTPIPVNPADYQGWWTYTDESYGFSLQLPADWVVDETTTGDPLMNGHLLTMAPQQPAAVDLALRMTFRRSGEDVPLWPSGVGSGEFIPQGTLEVGGQAARRTLFVCTSGQVNEIWYQGETQTNPNIQIGNLEFGFILSYKGAYCEDGYSLGGKSEYVGELIIASLNVK
jgi:putative hemolysin